MNDPTTHDFDWVAARLGCSAFREFGELRTRAKANVSTMVEGGRNDLYFKCNENGKEFHVGLSGGTSPAREVFFELKSRHLIHIYDTSDATTKYDVTVALGRQGQCHYAVNREGKYLRWQLLRKVLEPLFFGEAGGLA